MNLINIIKTYLPIGSMIFFLMIAIGVFIKVFKDHRKEIPSLILFILGAAICIMAIIICTTLVGYIAVLVFT